MTLPVVSTTPEACVWMTAGVLNYKLCDRSFDCEHCPLDIAMRGHHDAAELPAATTEPSYGGILFPDDRRYSGSHLWIAPAGDGSERVRIGLDAFAALLISCPRRIRWARSDCPLAPGETVCELDLSVGLLRVGAPFAARSIHANGELRRDPWAVAAEPYGSGWLADLLPDDPEATAALLTPVAARRHAELDYRHFRRRVAHHLLANGGALQEESLDRHLGSLADLRQLLGPPRYLLLLRDLFH